MRIYKFISEQAVISRSDAKNMLKKGKVELFKQFTIITVHPVTMRLPG